MSTQHGEPITQKPISEMAKYLKNLIPVHIPETYPLKPLFENVADEENVRKGVVAFRDFLYLLCDRLISDGHLYTKPQKNPKSETDYPFLNHLATWLTGLGYHGRLSDNGDSLVVAEMPSLMTKFKISAPKQKDCLRFLEGCGFVFNFPEADRLAMTYPSSPFLLTGLKALAIADTELRVERSRNDHIFLRCDYRVMMAEETDPLEALKDFAHPLPEAVRDFALALHRCYVDKGMACVPIVSTFEVHFAYAFVKNSRRDLSVRDIYYLRVWEFALSPRYGYNLVIRAKHTDQYADVTEKFPLPLQAKIARGYGCDRKLHNERCQGGCQGFRLPLDGTLLDIRADVETWLAHEISVRSGTRDSAPNS